MDARQSRWCKTAAAATLTSALGLSFFHAATDGFRAYTFESARRLEALRSPRAVPDRILELSDGRRVSLIDLPAPVLLVDFVYTRCMSYCVALGSVSARLQRDLAPEIATGEVRLVSVSFDPTRDGPEELAAYRSRFSREASGWDLGRPLSADDLSQWLSAFGVVVIADEWGGFAHNAALHLVGPDRKLAAIHGLNDVEGAIHTTRALLARRIGREAAH